MRHSKLADRIEEVISDPTKMGVKLKVRRAGWEAPERGLRVGWAAETGCESPRLFSTSKMY